MGVGPHEGHLLKLFGMEVRRGFGHACYQVGSSVKQKSGWRDVDVRLLLPDDEYAMYFGDPRPEHRSPRLRAWNLAWTMLGRQMTGLPIDFQIQQVTLANEEFGGGWRSALIIASDEM
jgi:hypothetical protein